MPSSAPATTETYTLSLHAALPISLTRPSPDPAATDRVVAANIDVVGIVTGLDRPPNLRRLEREVVVASGGGARPMIVLTKADLHSRSEEHTSELQSLTNLVCRLLLPRPPRPTLFPYTPLFRSP